jgi:glycosyltransferase involved in cell wall biosynthesis
MPTRDRAAWIPRAIECWQAQTYQPLQLVVLDNGAHPIKDLLPTDPRIIYTRTGQGMKIGMLRNLACSVSTGEFIAHWDDDDWYAPNRIERQMQAIGDAQVCALRTCLFDEPGTVRRYEAPPTHAVGASFLYRRDWWLKNRFAADAHVGEDALFFSKAAKQAVLLDGDDLLVASIHGANTSPRHAKNEWKKGGTLPQGYRWV